MTKPNSIKTLREGFKGRVAAGRGAQEAPRRKSSTAKPDPRAVAFFLKHAGSSYSPGETPEQGKKRGATALAKAEQEATARGWTVEWEQDPEGMDTIGDIDPETVKEILIAVLYDEQGNVLGSLGGIVNPDRNYGRVVEAEMALEALSESGIARQVGGRRTREAPRNVPADVTAANELVLYIENTSDLSPDGPRGQGRDVLLNALRKFRKGTYDPALAVKLFGYLVESGAKRYAKEFGSSEREWSTMFPPATRQEAARQLEASFRNSAERGEYDHVDVRTGAAARGIASEAPLGGGYSLRQSPENASMYDAYFERTRIGSVRGPFGSRDGRKTFYDWTLNGPRGQATGRARTQTAAFNQLISKHKERRAIGADVSQVLPYDPSAPGPHPRVREDSRDRDRPISMTYGQLPPFEQFEQDIRRPDPDRPGQAYWPEGTLYPMELTGRREIEIVDGYGATEEFDADRPRGFSARGFRYNEEDLYGLLQYLIEQDDIGEEGGAMDLASPIMTTLGYEWI